MTVALKEDYQRVLDGKKRDVRELIMVGLEQINEGKTKDFDMVCDRIEKSVCSYQYCKRDSCEDNVLVKFSGEKRVGRG